MLCGELAESSYGLAYQAILEGSEACAEIPQRHIVVWIVVQTDKGSEASGLHRCGLGRDSIRLEELQFPGTIGNKDQLHLAQQQLNTWLLVNMHVRPFGCRIF